MKELYLIRGMHFVDDMSETDVPMVEDHLKIRLHSLFGIGLRIDKSKFFYDGRSKKGAIESDFMVNMCTHPKAFDLLIEKYPYLVVLG